MSYGLKLHVHGDFACFTRPEMKAERVSYDVLTPSAARGILEAVHWKPAIRWVVDRIHVLKPIRFTSIRRNEVGSKVPVANVRKAMKTGDVDGLMLDAANRKQRVQRASLVLRDVAYLIEAHFEMTDRAGPEDTPAKHAAMAARRAAQGQCFHRPCLGTREFPAEFALVEDVMPTSELSEADRDRDLGWMLLDIDHSDDARSLFFRAMMKDGVIDVPHPRAAEVRS
jgi:CRISPR-associated protein Cas5d